MSGFEIAFLVLVVIAFGAFAAALGYTDWRCGQKSQEKATREPIGNSHPAHS
jgi:hypothetical protein